MTLTYVTSWSMPRGEVRILEDAQLFDHNLRYVLVNSIWRRSVNLRMMVGVQVNFQFIEIVSHVEIKVNK